MLVDKHKLQKKNIKPFVIQPAYFPLIFVVVASLVHGLFNAMAVSFGYNFPNNTFLYNPSDLFADYFKPLLSYPGSEIINIDRWPLLSNYMHHNPYGGLVELKSGGLTRFQFPPLTQLIYIASRQLISLANSIYLYLLCTAIWFVPFTIFLKGYVKDNKLFLCMLITFLLSYPFLLSITRGNVGSGMVGIPLILAILLSLQRKTPLFVALLLAIAINIRPNAIVFLGIFFFIYCMKDAIYYSILSLCFIAVLFFCSLFLAHYLYAEYRFMNFYHALYNYYNIYVVNDWGLQYESSGLGAIKVIAMMLHLQKPTGMINLAVSISSLLLVGIGFYFYTLKWLSSLAGIFILSACYVMASSVFADYHLLVLFLFIIFYSNQLHYHPFLDKTDWIILLSALIVIIPKNYLFLHHGGAYSIQVILDPLVLFCGTLSILYLAYRNHWHRSQGLDHLTARRFAENVL